MNLATVASLLFGGALLLLATPSEAGCSRTARKLGKLADDVAYERYDSVSAALADFDEVKLARRRCAWAQRRYYLVRGLVGLGSGDYDAAAADFRRHIVLHQERDELDPLVYAHLGKAHLRAGRPSDALQALRTAQEQGVTVPGLYELRAEAHRQLGALDEARETLSRGLERHPDHVAFLVRSALLEIDAGRVDEALDIVETWRASVTDEEVRALGQLLRERGHEGAARSVLREGPAEFLWLEYDEVPAAREQPVPEYPASAREAKIEGHVVAVLEVDKAGAVVGVEVVEAEPEGVFEEAARAALQRWTFEPVNRDGEAVKVTFRQPVAFRLR